MSANTSRNPILVVDDDRRILESLKLALTVEGLGEVRTCSRGEEAVQLLGEQEFDAVLLDIIMPGMNGEEVLAHITEHHPDIPVIMVTGVNDVETAVQCMRRGAYDYILKPADKGQLAASLRRALESRELRRRSDRLARSFMDRGLRTPEAFAGIVTRSPAMQDVFRYCEAVSESDEPVLITGETGTGKELLARALYAAMDVTGKFVAVNAAGLDEQTFSDTLFGHRRGAFTGADKSREGMMETAAGGVLFLDEIGDLSQANQVKLLRALQEREFYPLGADAPRPLRARVVAATHRSVDELQAHGDFRADFFYRIRTHHAHVPPLRERREDLGVLFDHFLARAAESLQRPVPAYPKEVLVLLRSYAFPGNVRELRSMVFDALSRHREGMLSMDTLKERMGLRDQEKGEPGGHAAGIFDDFETLPTLKDADRALVDEALRRAEQNQRLAAAMLGISPQALNNRLRRDRKEE